MRRSRSASSGHPLPIAVAAAFLLLGSAVAWQAVWPDEEGARAAESGEAARDSSSTPAATPPPTAPPPLKNPHGSFQAECGLCHGASAWSPAQISPRFDHGRLGFELGGAHAAAACGACHGSLDFKQSATQCAGCHEDIHRGEMGVDCARCHTARSFIDRTAMSRAHQLTRFPLTGSHVMVDCESCHPGVAQGHLQFVNTRADCESCHLEDYRTAVPDHSAGGFSLRCEMCHSTMTWSSARFDHNGTDFPLTGAHRTLSCQSCHGGGVYAGTNPDCASCHRTDYDQTTNPSHSAAGFPLECASCHSTSTWDGARFDHDQAFFPIYSGAHRGRWQSCAECHTNPASYAQFTCFQCHEHNQPDTDDHHQEVANYVYDSQACFTCHPRGTH
jgi:hypothetical protein